MTTKETVKHTFSSKTNADITINIPAIAIKMPPMTAISWNGFCLQEIYPAKIG